VDGTFEPRSHKRYICPNLMIKFVVPLLTTENYSPAALLVGLRQSHRPPTAAPDEPANTSTMAFYSRGTSVASLCKSPMWRNLRHRAVSRRGMDGSALWLQNDEDFILLISVARLYASHTHSCRYQHCAFAFQRLLPWSDRAERHMPSLSSGRPRLMLRWSWFFLT
jgi:hypothetical protein